MSELEKETGQSQIIHYQSLQGHPQEFFQGGARKKKDIYIYIYIYI